MQIVRRLGQSFMFGHLFPSIIRQGVPQHCGDRPKLPGEVLAGTRRICSVHLGENDQACGPLHQGADGRPITGVLEQVALPVTGHRAGIHLSGTRGDRRHLGNLASAISAACPRAPRLACLLQRGQQLTAQSSAGQTDRQRWSQASGACTCHQDTCGGGVPQSDRANSPPPDASLHNCHNHGS